MRTHLEFDDFGEYEEVFDEAEGELYFVDSFHTQPEQKKQTTAA